VFDTSFVIFLAQFFTIDKDLFFSCSVVFPTFQSVAAYLIPVELLDVEYRNLRRFTTFLYIYVAFTMIMTRVARKSSMIIHNICYICKNMVCCTQNSFKKGLHSHVR